MLSEAKHLKSRPTKPPRSHPTSCLSDPAALQSRRAQGRFANRPCCAFAQNDRVRQGVAAARGGVAPLRPYDMAGRDFRCFASLSMTVV